MTGQQEWHRHATRATRIRRRAATSQRGVSLIELLVGIALGLLTIAVAVGALLISRSVSSTVSDTTHMQQRAAHAFRVIGRQIRQAGSLRLHMETTDPTEPVAFEIKTGNFDAANTLRGIDKPGAGQFTLTVGYTSYPDPVGTASSTPSFLTDCLDQQPIDGLVRSAFVLYVNPRDATQRDLRCKGKADDPQPLIQNVADFQVRYLVQDESASPGSPSIRYVNAQGVGTNWAEVTALEVCLVLYGGEPIDVEAGTSYIGCDGSAINIAELPAPRKKRMHMAFRTVYQLRSQGVVGGS